MSYESSVKKIVTGLDKYPDEFINAVSKIEKRILEEVLPMLDDLELDSAGNVIPNGNNFAITNDITRKIETITYQSGYREALQKYGLDMAEQRAATDTLYRLILDDADLGQFDAVFNNTRSAALRVMGEGAVNAYKAEFTAAIETSIATGSKFSDVVKSVRTSTVGNADVDGVLLRYGRQNAKDAFAVQNRVYSENINKTFGIKWYRYSGANMDSTRPFCLKRQGGYFHENEVRSWAGESWQGKNRNTNPVTIFAYLGGYNCNHILMAVPVDRVPIEDIRRAINEGYQKLSDLPKKIQDKLAA